jgi:hypothetical protein
LLIDNNLYVEIICKMVVVVVVVVVAAAAPAAAAAVSLVVVVHDNGSSVSGTPDVVRDRVCVSIFFLLTKIRVIKLLT